jgi:hypothetical protein
MRISGTYRMNVLAGNNFENNKYSQGQSNVESGLLNRLHKSQVPTIQDRSADVAGFLHKLCKLYYITQAILLHPGRL